MRKKSLNRRTLTGELPADRTPEKCVLFPLFENLFLGALLAFLCSFCTRRGKKLLILNASRGPEMLCEGRKEGKKDMKDSEKSRS